ncbi:MAG TPA: M28 family metallopeptidase [Steroidobacteraceae bacterium]
MKKLKLSLTLAAALITTVSGAADPLARAAKVGERCWRDVRVLADDGMEGRRAGSEGHRRAARFVADEFRMAGLRPGAGGGFLQPVQLDMRLIDESKSSLGLVVNGEPRPLKLGDDAGFNLRGNFAPEVEAPLVFVGHGLVLPQYGIDDLAGLDLKGKIVVAFSTAPSSVPGSVGAHFGSSPERWKMYSAAGAVGMVMLSNPFTMDLPWERAVQQRLDPFMVLRGLDDQYVGQKAWVMFNPASFGKLLEGTPHKPEELLALLKDGKTMPHFDLAARLVARQHVNITAVTSENVIGMLPGSDPTLRDEMVVLSAHLDHLGVRDGTDADRIYNGALDNAAGISVLIQTARDLKRGKAPKRSIVFAAVTAEEMGLLGSRAYVAWANSARRNIVANLNSDMFLPLYPMKQVVVFGLEESDLADDARAVAAELGIEVQTDPQPQRNRFIRSDQYSFIRAGIPSLATKIGVVPGTPEAEIEKKWQAERYHGVSDDLNQPVDFAAIGTYQEFVRRLAVQVADRAEKPRWHDTSVFR